MTFICEDCQEFQPEFSTLFIRAKYKYYQKGKDIETIKKVCRACYLKNGEEIK